MLKDKNFKQNLEIQHFNTCSIVLPRFRYNVCDRDKNRFYFRLGIKKYVCTYFKYFGVFAFLKMLLLQTPFFKHKFNINLLLLVLNTHMKCDYDNIFNENKKVCNNKYVLGVKTDFPR